MPLPGSKPVLTSADRGSGTNHLLFWGAILLMLVGAAFLKLPALHNGAPNLEASYHVLLSVSALAESPIAEHHLLPTISLGSVYDKNIPWGGALLLPSGHYVYTSFAAPGFLAPFVFFKVTGLPITLHNLMLFNFLLQALATIALVALLQLLLRTYAVRGPTWLPVLAGVSIQIFSSEALLSYGIIYWSQQLYQIILISSLICVVHILRRDGKNSVAPLGCLALLCFFGPWTEWTGFVFNGALTLFFGWKGLSERRYLWMACLVAGVTTAALIVLVAQYAAYIGLLPTLKAFAKRFLARSAAHSGPGDLLHGYVRSFGLLIPLAILAVLQIWRTRPGAGSPASMSILWAILGLGTIPLFENLLMMQHASQFSFDRLKMAIPIAIALTFGFGLMRSRWRIIGALLLLGALVQNYGLYRKRLAEYATWSRIDRDNHRLHGEIAKLIDPRCAVLTSRRTVRGYDNLLFHRGIYESVSAAAFDRYAATERGNRCGAVYLEGSAPFPDMMQYQSAIVRRGGHMWHPAI